MVEVKEFEHPDEPLARKVVRWLAHNGYDTADENGIPCDIFLVGSPIGMLRQDSFPKNLIRAISKLARRPWIGTIRFGSDRWVILTSGHRGEAVMVAEQLQQHFGVRIVVEVISDSMAYEMYPQYAHYS